MIRSVVLLLVIPFSGCAALGTFQTPEVAEPGHITIGFGAGLGPLGTKLSNSADIDDIPLVAPEIYARVGVLPRLELGARAALPAVGLDLKFQLIRRPVALSLAGGLGYGGLGDYEIRTLHGAILLGRGDFYGGLKLTDYYAKEFVIGDCDACTGYTRRGTGLLPSFALGFVGTKWERLRPILELNTYVLSEKTRASLSAGFQVRF